MDPDQTADAFFGSTLALTTGTHILQIPSKTLQQDTPQFDFMYSNIYERNLTTNPDFASAVPLEFSHLFTAFNVTALNNSTNTIVLKSVTLTDLKDIKSATINYTAATGTTGSTAATVTYAGAATSGDSFIFTNSGLTLTGTAQAVADYYLMWPQTAEELDVATVTVVYDYTEKATGVTTSNVSKTIPLSSLDPWIAGKKNNLNLVFKDKEIILQCVVEPWTWEQQEIEFTDAVTVTQTMQNRWENVASVNYDTGEVILKQSTSQQASVKFKIDSPLGATWTASLIMIEGATDAIQFVEGYKYGKVGEAGEIRLRVAKDTPIENRNSYYLRITIQTADGNTIVATGLTGSENYEEFKIIQNLIN